MAFETVGTFSPSIKNPLSGATGLIQFMPSTARSLGTTTAKLAQMSREDQLYYVEKYLSPYSGRLKNIYDLAMSIFYPASIGNPDYKFPQKVVKQNPGIYTPRDYVNKVINKKTSISYVQSNTKPTKKENTPPNHTMAQNQNDLLKYAGIGLLLLAGITIIVATSD